VIFLFFVHRFFPLPPLSSLLLLYYLKAFKRSDYEN
jgi:hypothetical protein